MSSSKFQYGKHFCCEPDFRRKVPDTPLIVNAMRRGMPTGSMKESKTKKGVGGSNRARPASDD
jgi:hypothetical protein